MINNKLILCVILAGGRGSRLDGKGKYSNYYVEEHYWSMFTQEWPPNKPNSS